MSCPKSNAINVQNISKSFKTSLAVHDISFQVDKGDIFGLIGPDGAGKTTLMRILVTLLLPDEGQAFIEGWDVVQNFRQIRRIVGYMPGQSTLYPDLSVAEHLQFFATVYGSQITANYDLIQPIYEQLRPFKKRRAQALSGGMKQKLALCCALIHRPHLLILDEPTTGVDPVSRKEFWDTLKILKNEGITTVVSTPYMDEARQCDRMALIQAGCFLSVNTPAKLIAGFPKQLYSIRSHNLHRLIHDLDVYPDRESVYLFGQDMHYTDRKSANIINPLKTYLQKKGHQHIQIRAIRPAIEDCFINLMQANPNLQKSVSNV